MVAYGRVNSVFDFFFQAEDGIRDIGVTGVQTCALPIWGISVFDWTDAAHPKEVAFFDWGPVDATKLADGGSWSAYWRSEERRVGKECKSRWSPESEKMNHE